MIRAFLFRCLFRCLFQTRSYSSLVLLCMVPWSPAVRTPVVGPRRAASKPAHIPPEETVSGRKGERLESGVTPRPPARRPGLSVFSSTPPGPRPASSLLEHILHRPSQASQHIVIRIAP